MKDHLQGLKFLVGSKAGQLAQIAMVQAREEGMLNQSLFQGFHGFSSGCQRSVVPFRGARSVICRLI